MSWQNISELILQVSQLTIGLCLMLTASLRVLQPHLHPA